MKREISRTPSTEAKSICYLIAGQCQHAQVSDEAQESFNRKPYYLDAGKVRKEHEQHEST